MDCFAGRLLLCLFGALVIASTGCASSTALPAGDSLIEVPVPAEQDISVLLTDSAELSDCKCDYDRRFTVLKEDLETLDAVSGEVYEFAIMSANAYDKDMQITLPGWKRTTRIVSIHGFSADVYLSEDDKRVVIAYRGTDDARDWRYANIDTDAGGQYRDADTVFQQVLASYPGKEIVTTGHSLGGGLAIYVAVSHIGVHAYVFDPSPRIFAGDNYGKYDTKVVVIYESGEILSLVRPLFTTLRKVNSESYRYNFLGGNIVKEHSIAAFARCMYASIHKTQSRYEQLCKKNTITH